MNANLYVDIIFTIKLWNNLYRIKKNTIILFKDCFLKLCFI